MEGDRGEGGRNGRRKGWREIGGRGQRVRRGEGGKDGGEERERGRNKRREGSPTLVACYGATEFSGNQQRIRKPQHKTIYTWPPPN